MWGARERAGSEEDAGDPGQRPRCLDGEEAGGMETRRVRTLRTLSDRPLFIKTRNTQPTTYVGGRGVCGLTVKPHTRRKQKGELMRVTPPGDVRKERKSRQRASGKAWLARRPQPGVQGWASKQNCAC